MEKKETALVFWNKNEKKNKNKLTFILKEHYWNLKKKWTKTKKKWKMKKKNEPHLLFRSRKTGRLKKKKERYG